MGHHHHHHHHAVQAGADSHAPELRKVTLAAVGVAALLVVAKLSGWTETGATSLLSSLLDSLFDMSMSALNFFAVRYALKPADEDHRFGHTSIEDIVGLAQFAFILGTMLLVIIESARNALNPQPIAVPEYGIGVMLFSMVLTGALVLYQRHVVRRTGSLIVQADSLHYLGDVLMNISIIASLLAAMFFHIHWLDSLLAIAIALYVIKEASEIGRRSFNNLMDREMEEEKKTGIRDIVARHPAIRSLHNLRTRQSGSRQFIQMDVAMDPELTLRESHRLTEALEADLRLAFPQADIIIHQEPQA